MMPLVFYSVLLLAIGWILSLRRAGFRTRALIMASVPVGGFVGGYAGSGVCWVVLHFQGRGESHNDLIAFAAAGILGMLVGGIGLPLVALLVTKPKNR